MNNEEQIMLRCIELARKGSGYVSPNPMVGCVITKNGFEISEGYHKKFGENHAEVNAINAALKKGLDLSGSTLYVNLEPCSHFGKTPPCADKIIENKIAKVVIGTKDSNALVAGKGIRKLQKHGIDVKVGVLVPFCIELNKFYFKYTKTGLPYVALKAAQTLDGKIADNKNNSKWISSIESRKLVHSLRSQYDAVLVGSNTVRTDDPQLNVRHAKGRNPFRIVIDLNLSLDVKRKLFNDGLSSKTIIITSKTSALKNKKKINYFSAKDVKIIELNSSKNTLKEVLKKLGKLGISSVMVEGGAKTFSEFIRHNLADEAYIFIAPKIFGSGLDVVNIQGKVNVNIKEFIWFKSGEDILVNFRFK
jgi:diaminohydroxyphosphoribosylaminopyrimidine deaminase/5-amino-6-(5-phosphoribosylamino)uracil reductase